MLLTTKQIKGESIEHFFRNLKKLPENCILGNQEETLISDIANIQDPEIQKELMNETVEPPQSLRLAINLELGHRNQLPISNSQSDLQLNAVLPQGQFRNSNQRQNIQIQTPTEYPLSPHLVSHS